MEKRAISKNYFHWEPDDEGLIFDKRLVDKYLEEGKKPVDSGLDYNNVDTKILIYEDRVKEWFLEIGNRLRKDNEAGFVILQIAVSYIEGNQQYREGTTSHRNSKSFFVKAMKRIFPEIISISNIDSLLESFYDQVRCGLFHDGMTKKFVTISKEYKIPLDISATDIKINPHKFLDKISEDLNRYISEIKDKSNLILRQKFENRWNTTG